MLKEQLQDEILQCLQPDLNDCQLERLRNTLYIKMYNYDIVEIKAELVEYDDSDMRLINLFLNTKLVEGRSKRTVERYKLVLRMLSEYFAKGVRNIDTNDLRYYLAKYKADRGVCNNTLDGMRRVISSFFAWLSDEGYIVKNPTRRLNQIKVEKTIKKPLSDEERERLKCICTRERDLALLEFLYSTGVRVGELVGLDRKDIRFQNGDCIVFGKGGKEREVYLNASSCLHLKNYLECRSDQNTALFVSEKAPYTRLTISGVEDILRRLGRKAGVEKVHPHRYRRTAATNALNRGMPLQEVSKMLGHAKTETTMIYCTINEESLRFNHKKYLSA